MCLVDEIQEIQVQYICITKSSSKNITLVLQKNEGQENRNFYSLSVNVELEIKNFGVKQLLDYFSVLNSKEKHSKAKTRTKKCLDYS